MFLLIFLKETQLKVYSHFVCQIFCWWWFCDGCWLSVIYVVLKTVCCYMF